MTMSDIPSSPETDKVRELEAVNATLRTERNEWREKFLKRDHRLTIVTILLGVLVVVSGIGGTIIWTSRQEVQDLSKITDYQFKAQDRAFCRSQIVQNHQRLIGRLILTQQNSPERASAVIDMLDSQDELDKVIGGEICPVPAPPK
jgi:hypothetical protein